MFAHVTSLRYWKSERADLTSCEDALRSDSQHGLFCVADGAGTTLFSNIWADILVEQFVRNPLMSSDPFEMDWWIRQAQKRYQVLVPTSEKLNWNARQKALEQGAYATLATLRFTRFDAQNTTAELLAIGDSCVIIGHQQQVTAFPLQHAEDFDRAPYCVPALLKNLNRNTLYAKTLEVTLAPGDIIVLATDAVARWIVSGGGTGKESNAFKALLEVANKTENDWPGFINACRANQLIVDDDSTALIIRLLDAGSDEERLGTPALAPLEMITQRKEEFIKARAQNNKELVAITYGDGRMLSTAGITLAEAEKMKAREVADALRAVLQAMRDALNLPNFVAKVEPIWWHYADLLMDEPCAENIRKGLVAQGVRLRRTPRPSYPVTPAAAPFQSGQQELAPDVSDVPSPPPETAKDVNGASGQSKPPFQPFTGNEPELARIYSPSVLSPVATQQPQVTQTPLQTFRSALATRDPFKIMNAYGPSIEGDLTTEDHARLEEARTRLQLELSNRLWTAIDQNDDDAILAAAKAIDSSPVEITLMESAKQRIQQARTGQTAFEFLLNCLVEGTAEQKVEAHIAISQKRKSLTPANQEQVDMAHRLVDALRSDNDDMICSAYEAIEFSPLRKHFLFPLEEQRRIQQARSSRAAVEQFRMILQSGGSTCTLLIQAYQAVSSPQSYLSRDEQRIIELIQRFVQSSLDDQQTVLLRNDEHLTQCVSLHDKLYYSPYQIVFTYEEERQIEQLRSHAHLSPPIIMVVDKVPVDIGQFLTFYQVKPLYIRSQVTALQRQLEKNPSEAEQQRIKNNITVWEKQLESPHLLERALNDLINQVMIDQKMNEEVSRGKSKRNLKNDVQRMLDELFKEFRNTYGKIVSLSGEELRNGLMPYALYSVFDHYLQATVPGQTLAGWLPEQRKQVSVYYYEYAAEQASQTTMQQDCWLFKWWQMRSMNSLSSLQGESGNA